MTTFTKETLIDEIENCAITSAYRAGYAAQYKGVMRQHNPHTHNIRRGVKCESIFGSIDKEPLYAEERKEQLWDEGFAHAQIAKSFGIAKNTLEKTGKVCEFSGKEIYSLSAS